MKKWVEVSGEEFDRFVRDNELKGREQFLHYELCNKEGEAMARFQHGFAFDMYSILLEENEEVVRSIKHMF